MNGLITALHVVNVAACVTVSAAVLLGVAYLALRWLEPRPTPEPPTERVYRSIDDCIPSRQSWR